MKFSITDSGKIKIIKLSGKVNWEDARVLDKKISSIIIHGCIKIAFVFDEVTSICSALIGSIAFNLNNVKKLNGAFYLISTNTEVYSIFENLKFDIVFDGYLFNSFEDFRKEVLDKEK